MGMPQEPSETLRHMCSGIACNTVNNVRFGDPDDRVTGTITYMSRS